MELGGWKLLAASMSVGVGAGLAFWMLASLSVRLAGMLPRRSSFAADLAAGAGEDDRRRYRATGKKIAVLLGGLLAGLLAGALAWLLWQQGRPMPPPAWSLVAAAGVSAVVLGAGAYRLVRLVAERRRLYFTWAARTAVGNILNRLNLAGNRIFHDVTLEGARIDHVVIGTRGVFAVNVVPRRVPKRLDGRATAELRNGKLRMAETVEALPVGDAARNMTLLAAALGRVIGHRVAVRSVLAVPGWHTVPNGEGNHLVLNENNLAMLTSWNKPEAYLMEEDCMELQKFLYEASARARLD